MLATAKLEQGLFPVGVGHFPKHVDSPGSSDLRMRTTNENERILVNLGKNGQKKRTLAKQGETESFAEFRFGITTPWWRAFIILLKFNLLIVWQHNVKPTPN